MKVTDIKPAVGPERVKPQDPATSSSAASEAANRTVRDRVTVAAPRASDTAVASARRSAGVERSQRLEKLEAQVRGGSYAPDPSRVAEQILSDAEVDARMRAMLNH